LHILLGMAAIYNPSELVYNNSSAEMPVPIKKNISETERMFPIREKSNRALNHEKI